MLSERIATLYALLQCSNTDIARYASCSSGNISRLKSGCRVPKPQSRTIALFANGVYGYADYENMLPTLCELCGAEDGTREALIPALVAWLYETDAVSLPPHAAVPKSKRTKELRRRAFGERLDRAMNVLTLTNGRLAALLNTDASLVSRYRSGVYSPHGNERMSERLTAILISLAKKHEKEAELAALCGAENGWLNAETLSAWLYGVPEEDPSAFAQMLLRSLDAFAPGEGVPAAVPEIPPVEIAERYWGTPGLRQAVVRFLSDAAQEGGELLLYSDEPMDWMTGDREYFALWAALMMRCVRSGVHVRIIHNLDRGLKEMVAAISGWFPLYITGMIEPYVFSKERSARFCYTGFLRAGAACVHGMFPAGAGERRWYDYITDAERLNALEAEYQAMLSAATPFLKTYTSATSAEFRAIFSDRPGMQNYLVATPPVFTMPEGLLSRMLARAAIPQERRDRLLAACRAQRERFLKTLETERVHLLLCLPDADTARRVDFSLGLVDLPIVYTPDEYAEHIAAVQALVRDERNFHLTLLPAAPFRDIQLITTKDAVAVLRRRSPYAAFVFMHPALTQSAADYFSALIDQYAADRQTMIAALEREKRQ